jgi:hypothetical protein
MRTSLPRVAAIGYRYTDSVAVGLVARHARVFLRLIPPFIRCRIPIDVAAMQLAAFAFDYDGTPAHDGEVDASSV